MYSERKLMGLFSAKNSARAPTNNPFWDVQFQQVGEGLGVGSWVDLTRWMYIARGGGGGGAGSWRTGERHGVMVAQSISWGAVYKRFGKPVAETEEI
jgi:hypothetical protein